MKIKFNEILKILSLMIVCFLLSFLDYNGAFFLVSFPISIALIFCKEKYFLYTYLSIVIASLFIGNSYLTLSLIAGLLMILLVFIGYRKTGVKLAIVASLSSFGFAFLYAGVDYYVLKGDPLNLLIIPLTIIITTYYLSEFIINSKSKDKFSLTQIEWLVFVSFLNHIILKSKFSILNFDISFVISSLFIYALTKINTTSSFFASLISLLIYMPQEDPLKGFLLLVPLLFITRIMSKDIRISSFVFLIISLALSLGFKNYSYIVESFFVFVLIKMIPSSIFYRVEKYIVDPKDYKIEQYREMYNKMAQKEKKVNSLIKVIEIKIKDNPRMKKKYNDKIAEDLNFLVNQSENIVKGDLKKEIINRLECIGAKVIGLRKEKTFSDDIKFTLETHYFDDYKKIIEVIEEQLQMRVGMKFAKYNFLTNTIKYEFVSEDRVAFDYFIKQRSVDKTCGDNYLCFKANNKKYFLISDGMGHGNKANEDSKFALFLLKNFIELGMNTKKAIESCNALVYSKNDTYNTLDVLEYDCFYNDIILYKNGSGNTYIQYKDFVDNLVSENLPLGIVDEINVNKLIIKDGVERIVLTSDGVSGNLVDLIYKNKGESINVLVNEIFKQDNEVKDDQTIMAINVIKK